MEIVIYLTLLLLPIPLMVFLIKRKHYLYYLPPFMAFIGIYIFDIIGSIAVISNESLFSWMYYFTLLLVVVFFYIFYIIIFYTKRKLFIEWNAVKNTNNYFIPFLLWVYPIFMFTLYFERHGLPPLFKVNFLAYTDMYALRAKGSTNLSEGIQWYLFAFNTIPAFILIYSYILKRLNPSSKTKLIFFINLFLTLFFSSLFTQKSPYVYIIIYIFVANLLLGGKAIKFKKVFGYFFLVIGVMIGMIRLYLMDRGFVEVLKVVPNYIFDRIFVTYTEAHAYIIKIFPDQHDFFYGSAFSNPGHIFPFEPVDLSQFLGFWVNSRLENYASPSFSHGYANFGLIGFLLILFIMFFQLGLLQILIKKCPRNSLFLSLYVLIIPNMLGYGNTGIQEIITEIYVLLFITLVFAFYFFRDVIIRFGFQTKTKT